MRVIAIPGKGGSAKSTGCVSLGLAFASWGEKTILLDNDSDGGSIWAMLRMPWKPAPNTVHSINSNFDIVAIKAPPFQNIWAFKKEKKKGGSNLKGYLPNFRVTKGSGPTATCLLSSLACRQTLRRCSNSRV